MSDSAQFSQTGAQPLVLRGGLIVDGTGAPARRGDLVIEGGRITEIAEVGQAARAGARIIDVDAAMVTPGFIDLHSHADFSITQTPTAPSQLAQGVTTLLVGNCGFSPFPVDANGRVERSSSFLAADLSWDWADAAGFAQAVTASGPAINIGLQLGHGSLRTSVLGLDDRAPSPAELEQMKQIISAAARAGAIGFSTGLIYPPGCYADRAELAELVNHAAAEGLILSTHMRDEGVALLAAIEEAIWLARESGIGLEISHLKATGPAHHGMVSDALALIDQAADEGVDVQADVYPYTASSTTLAARLPSWARDGGDEALRARLADPQIRDRIAAEVENNAGRTYTPEGVVVAGMPPGSRYSWAAGMNVAEIAQREGISATEAILSVLSDTGSAASMVNHSMAERDVEAALTHPRVSVASDGWLLAESGPGQPHPRSFGTFARVLGHYVRERGILSWEQAIYKMTALPAKRAGLTDRGQLRVGAVADVVVFDPDTVIDRSTYDFPWQLASGVEHVFVAGVSAWRNGELTEQRAGGVLDRSTSGRGHR